MDVYLIPIGRHRHELYCEPPGDTLEGETSPDDAPPGVAGRIRRRFVELLRAAEQHQRAPVPTAPPPGHFARAQERMMAWVAERIAEQRLLWRLRRETAATAVHPQDMPASEAMTLVREVLQRDADRHRRWLIVDVILLVVAGALAILPGPNVVAYYFAFRVWGHWLSMRGAAQGLQRVTWTTRPCAVLGELRDLEALAPPVRTARLREIAARLHLPHLTVFFERLAVRLRPA